MGDLNQLGADDRVGRKLQDLELEPALKRRTATRAKAINPSSASDSEKST